MEKTWTNRKELCTENQKGRIGQETEREIMTLLWVLLLFFSPDSAFLSGSLYRALSSDLNMKTVCSSHLLVPTYNSTWCHNPEDQHGHLH
jgi:hypothetical protein